jgi:hypothetical protein
MTQPLLSDEEFLDKIHPHKAWCDKQNKRSCTCGRQEIRDNTIDLIKQQQQAYGESREMMVWQNVKSCVENTNENTQRLMRFHLPDFDKRIEQLRTKNTNQNTKKVK